MEVSNIIFDAIDKFAGAKVLCVGEVVLDKFIYAKTKRLSSEAPIPVFLFENENSMLGATGNVASNLATLNAKTILISVAGEKPQDKIIEGMLNEKKVEHYMILDKGRDTTIKTRFSSKGQQMFRFDRETGEIASKEIEDKIIAETEKHISNVQVLILSEYNQGILTERVIRECIAIANNHNVPVVIDPRGTDYSKYKGATIVTPNKKELETLVGYELEGEGEIYNAAIGIMQKCGIENLLVTRDKDGMSLVSKNQSLRHIEARPVKVLDVSGAGDTVITGLALAIANGQDMYTASYIANAAAGVAVGKLGTATVDVDELKAELKEIRSYEQK